jgi:DNA-directed RNA polymerase specialized sigma24 family protein
MRQRRAATDRRRAREFESFVAGAAGRLLHAAVLLTGEPPPAAPRAERLLTAALAATYAQWWRLRADDPYDHARAELALRYVRGAWHDRHTGGGTLAPLGPWERVVLVLRLQEGVGEEQTAALLGLPQERIRAVYARAVVMLREAARSGPGSVPGPLPGPEAFSGPAHPGPDPAGPGCDAVPPSPEPAVLPAPADNAETAS